MWTTNLVTRIPWMSSYVGIKLGHITWTSNLDKLRGHQIWLTWTSNLATLREHKIWPHYVGIKSGHITWTSYLITLRWHPTWSHYLNITYSHIKKTSNLTALSGHRLSCHYQDVRLGHIVFTKNPVTHLINMSACRVWHLSGGCQVVLASHNILQINTPCLLSETF